MQYDAVIFDNDGVITEPTAMEVFRSAIRATFGTYGVAPTAEDVDEIMHGNVTHLHRVCDRHEVPVDDFWSLHEATAAEAQRTVLESGEKRRYEDVSALDAIDAPLGLVSNNQHATVEHVVDVCGLEDTFAVVYGREPTVDGLRRTKPSPYYLERALSALDVEDALYVGDSNVDVLAASRAGVDSAFVRRPHRADYELAAEPTYELPSLDDLLAVC